MNNKPEDTADISAELRDLSRSAGYCELQPTVFGKPITRYFAELADRIDAAKMRECAEQREEVRGLHRTIVKLNNAIAELGEKPCNMAAMRDALVAVKKLFDGRLMFQQAIRACHEKVNRALAEPPRNCDRFGGDFKMLHTAWFDWTGTPSGQNPDGTVKLTFAEWLLEIAEVHHA